MIQFRVVGIPASQGSKRNIGNGRMIECSKKVKPWRESVKAAALVAMDDRSHFPMRGPLRAVIEFTFCRPKGHYGTGKNADRIKERAPYFQASKPDLDKLVRSTFDALTESGIWMDDAQVVELVTSKHFDQRHGAIITISESSALSSESLA